MKTTENFKLKKPEATDFYNVDDFNENMDTIDVELNLHKNKLLEMAIDYVKRNGNVGATFEMAYGDHNFITKAEYGNTPPIPEESNYIYIIGKGSSGKVEGALAIGVDYSSRLFKYSAKDNKWEALLPLSGGTLTGGLGVSNGLGAIHGYTGGEGRVVEIYASESDTDASVRRAIQVLSGGDIKDTLKVVDITKDGHNRYRLYGEHNKPTVEEVSGALSKDDLNSVFTLSGNNLTINLDALK